MTVLAWACDTLNEDLVGILLDRREIDVNLVLVDANGRAFTAIHHLVR